MVLFEEWLQKMDDPDNKLKMEEIFDWIHDNFPNLGTVVKWNEPMFTDHGTYIIGFSTHKNHLSVGLEGAAVKHFTDLMQERKLDATKMTVRFKWTEPIDYDFLDQVIAYQIETKKDVDTFWHK